MASELSTHMNLLFRYENKWRIDSSILKSIAVYFSKFEIIRYLNIPIREEISSLFLNYFNFSNHREEGEESTSRESDTRELGLINSLKHLYLAFYDKSRPIITFLMLECPFSSERVRFLTTKKKKEKKIFMHLSLEKKKEEETNTDRHNWTGKSVAKNEFLKRRGKTNFRWERMNENNFNDAKLNV